VLRVLAAAAAATVVLPAAAGADGPAAYQADPAHTGAAQGASFAPPLGKRWVRRDLAAPSFPVIAENRVFVTAESGLYALDLESGATVWSRSLKSNGVAYDDGRVFAVDREGVMQAFAAQTGQVLWTAELPGSSSYVSPPTAYGEFVYASTDYTMFGVRQDLGVVAWSRSVTTDAGSVPAVDEQKAYTIGHCVDTTALQRTVGAEVWSYSDDCLGGIGSTPVLHGGRVYSYSGGRGVVLDSLTGLLADSFAATLPPAFAGDSGYFVDDMEVFARSESTGLVQWRNPMSERLAVPPLVVGDHVYTVTDAGKVLALSRASGAVTWEGTLRASGYYSSSSSQEARLPGLAAAGDRLVVSAKDRVTAYGPGADTPGVDDPDKPSGAGGELELAAAPKRTVFGRSVLLSGRLEAPSGGTTPEVELQADPWPYGSWQRLAGLEVDSSYFRRRVRPDRNTRYRAVYSGTNPALESPVSTVFSDVALRLRLFSRGRSRRKVLVRVSAAGPRDARLRRRPVYVYHYRQRARAATRIGALRLRGGPTRARAQRVMRTPLLRRTDLFFICRRERRDDGFGRPEPRLRACGSRRLR
jgi:outer membrane protein assembly factor BamB